MNGALKLAQLNTAVSNAVSSTNERHEEEITIKIVVSRVRRNAPLHNPDDDARAALVKDLARAKAGTSVDERAVRSRAITIDLHAPAANDHFEEIEHASPELVAVGHETLIGTPLAAATTQPAAALSSDEELVFCIEELELDLDDSGIVSIQTESTQPLSFTVLDQRACAALPADAEIELDASDLFEIENDEALEDPRNWLRHAA